MPRNNKSSVTFHKPFDGRPSPLPIVGLCLLAPAVHNKIHGIGIQREVASLGLAAVLKRLTRFLRRGGPERPSDRATVAGILDGMSAKLGASVKFEPFQRALAGDVEAQRWVDGLGMYEALFHGLGAGPETWEGHHFYLVAAERASNTVLELCRRGDWPSAADFAAQHPLLQQVLWPSAYERLRTASSLNNMAELRFSMAGEVHLGFLAAWDVARGNETGPLFGCLMPSSVCPGRNPTSLFYDELQRRLGKASMGAVLSSKEGSQTTLDRRTLERWSAGSHSPEVAKLRALLEAYGMHSEEERLYPQLWCAKHLNMLGHYAESAVDQCQPALGAALTRSHAARYVYPFGHESFQCWVADRYPKWLAYHRKQADQVRALALDKGAG